MDIIDINILPWSLYILTNMRAVITGLVSLGLLISFASTLYYHVSTYPDQ